MYINGNNSKKRVYKLISCADAFNCTKYLILGKMNYIFIFTICILWHNYLLEEAMNSAFQLFIKILNSIVHNPPSIKACNINSFVLTFLTPIGPVNTFKYQNISVLTFQRTFLFVWVRA